jgi:hypothetical protein
MIFASASLSFSALETAVDLCLSLHPRLMLDPQVQVDHEK